MGTLEQLPNQGPAAPQCLPSRSGSPRRRGESSPTAHSVHSRPSRRRIRLSSRHPHHGRRQHGFSASTTVRWAWATSWRTLATCASELCKDSWSGGCVWHYVINKVLFCRVPCV